MKKKGFTFIELLVVVAIIMVLSGGSLVGFNRLREKRQVRADADRVVQLLKEARTRATAGEKPSVCLGDLVNYKVEVSSTTISLLVECEDSGESQLKATSLQDSAAASGGFVTSFDALGGAVPETIQICGNSGSYGYDIEVTDSGLIEAPVENGGC